ncbi:hypothetical protein ACHWQZ_G016511 [Mnemiopsis leidyi]
MSDKEPILNSAEFDIDFQDFSNTIPNDAATIPTSQFSDFQPSLMTEGDTKLTVESDVSLEEENTPAPTTSAFWSFQFYQQYFNVDDQMVLERLMFACIPTLNGSYLERLKPLPDLYGPLWVCITLIFSTAISGNMADFFSSLGKDTNWEYDFKKVSIAGTVVFSYVTVVPALLSGFLWWRKSNAPVKLADILSLYGYSMSLFVPVSLLLCINYEWVRWILVVALVSASGGVLSLTMWKVLEEEPKQLALILTGILLALHVALILLFKVYFFTATESSSGGSASPT